MVSTTDIGSFWSVPFVIQKWPLVFADYSPVISLVRVLRRLLRWSWPFVSQMSHLSMSYGPCYGPALDCTDASMFAKKSCRKTNLPVYESSLLLSKDSVTRHRCWPASPFPCCEAIKHFERTYHLLVSNHVRIRLINAPARSELIKWPTICLWEKPELAQVLQI